jgi:hypothetical protein
MRGFLSVDKFQVTRPKRYSAAQSRCMVKLVLLGKAE